MRVAVQPCSDPAAQKHYRDTVLNPVSAARIRPYLRDEQLAAFDRHCGTEVAVWGVTAGKTGQNAKKWAKLTRGDIALLYASKHFFCQGTIALCIHNAPLAVDLWGQTAEGATWEYLYFLDEVESIDVTLDRYNAALQYQANNIVQGFQVHEDQQADAILIELDVPFVEDDAADLGATSLSKADLQARLLALLSTDLPATKRARQESHLLRLHLFGTKRTAQCALCARELPTHLLVAAHIKPRASCSDVERRDLNVVMAACRLGCDELYERGYVMVDDGGIVRGTESLSRGTQGLRNAAAQIVDANCLAHAADSAPYFAWHRTNPRRYLS